MPSPMNHPLDPHEQSHLDGRDDDHDHGPPYVHAPLTKDTTQYSTPEDIKYYFFLQITHL